MPGAIEKALDYRKTKTHQATIKRRGEEAVRALKELGCGSIHISEDKFQHFALTVAEYGALKKALAKARDAGISVLITDQSSQVLNDDIYIKYDDPPEQITEFLIGGNTGIYRHGP